MSFLDKDHLNHKIVLSPEQPSTIKSFSKKGSAANVYFYTLKSIKKCRMTYTFYIQVF